MNARLSPHLQRLEEESITILREAMATAENPVFLYSIGKDSSVLLHLLLKSCFPAQSTIPLLHIDTLWKFREMIAFRDHIAKKFGLTLHVYTNPRGKTENINPFIHGSRLHTQIMKTDALKQALDKYAFDSILVGTRRDEEKSRAKERIFSIRNRFHGWDPKNQRPEFNLLFNTRLPQHYSVRVSPLANWTEYDVWCYIQAENIEIVPLYFAKKRPVIRRNESWILQDDERLIPEKTECVEMRFVRFRTLGCYPLTGAIDSQATTLNLILKEVEKQTESERINRLIDQDQGASMERKKRQGYF